MLSSPPFQSTSGGCRLITRRFYSPEIWCQDLREPRIIAAAGNRGHLWGEQHGIETRTKRNHSWVKSGIIRG
jgi:hypothetical protein